MGEHKFPRPSSLQKEGKMSGVFVEYVLKPGDRGYCRDTLPMNIRLKGFEYAGEFDFLPNPDYDNKRIEILPSEVAASVLFSTFQKEFKVNNSLLSKGEMKHVQQLVDETVRSALEEVILLKEEVAVLKEKGCDCGRSSNMGKSKRSNSSKSA